MSFRPPTLAPDTDFRKARILSSGIGGATSAGSLPDQAGMVTGKRNIAQKGQARPLAIVPTLSSLAPDRPFTLWASPPPAPSHKRELRLLHVSQVPVPTIASPNALQIRWRLLGPPYA